MWRVGVTHFKLYATIESTPRISARRWSSTKSSNDPTDFSLTVTHGVKSRIVTDGWLPGRYIARWRKDELARAVRRAGWTILEFRVVTNRERKGRWLNLLAQKQG